MSSSESSSDNSDTDRQQGGVFRQSRSGSDKGAGSDSDSPPSHRSTSQRADDSDADLPVAQRSEESESERSSASPVKRRNLIDSSDNDEEGDKNKASASHIFGDEVSSDSDDEQGDARKKSVTTADGHDSDRSGKSEDSIHGIRLYPDQDEEPDAEEDQQPTIIETETSKIDVDYGEGAYYCKFPNFLSIEVRPFDPEYYDEDEDDDNVDDEGRSRLKLKVENTIRWRYGQDEKGNEIKESNAKIVKWSDGTMSLYLGSEIFDVHVMPVVSNTHLYIRQGAGLIGQTIFDHRLQFRPHSTDSKTHRKVTLNMADRSRKTGQVKMLTDVGNNPDEVKREAVRREEEALRAAIRRESQQRRMRERPRGGLSSGFLEGRDDSDEESMNNIKNRYKQRYDAPLIGASDSDESDGGRRLEGAKEDNEDSDEEFRKKKQQQKKKIVTSDEESD